MAGLLDRFFDRLRHARAADVAALPITTGVPELDDADLYLLLVTYRRSGAPVATPVWFARDGEALYVRTQCQSGKVKRIRRNSDALIARSSARGKPLGAASRARARVVDDPTEAAGAERALARKYGLRRRVYRKLAGEGDPVYLALNAPGRQFSPR